MGLYDGIEGGEGAPSGQTWSGAPAPAAAAAPAATPAAAAAAASAAAPVPFAPPPTKRLRGAAPAASAAAAGGAFLPPPSKRPHVSPESAAPVAPPAAIRRHGVAQAPAPDSEEYDPARPHDYDEVVRQRAQQRLLQQQEEAQRASRLAELEERRQWEERERRRLQMQKPTEAGLKVTAEEAFRRRMEMSKERGSLTAAAIEEDELREQEAEAKIRAETERKMTKAERMMSAQGWVPGKGLGRKEDGMVGALEVVKLGDTQGLIRETQTPIPQAPGALKKRGGTRIQGKPSKVLLLRNMVGPGEVDDELQGETAQECTKYGEVKSVQIFEAKDRTMPPEEVVRIFVKFERIPEAMKAIVDLDGRLFAGRTVSACFYDEAKYDLSLLDPQPEEPPMPEECRRRVG